MFIIQLTDRTAKNGRALYVCQPGSRSAYTTSQQAARWFSSYHEALAECCGNERPIEVHF